MPALNEIDRLVDEYRSRGVFLDTNILVLLVTGSLWPDGLEGLGHTSSYGAKDYALLLRFCSLFRRIVTSPYVLAEASNILPTEEERERLKLACIDRWFEIVSSSHRASNRSEFSYLGLADASIIEDVCGEQLVVTDDKKLAVALLCNEGGVVPFKLLRDMRDEVAALGMA